MNSVFRNFKQGHIETSRPISTVTRGLRNVSYLEVILSDAINCLCLNVHCLNLELTLAILMEFSSTKNHFVGLETRGTLGSHRVVVYI